MDELMLLSTYLPWVRHQIGRLFAGPLSSASMPSTLPPTGDFDDNAAQQTSFARRPITGRDEFLRKDTICG